ncbi:hypothetical protein GCM10009539_75430 [Cryptosporangium japonicum]|uniref:Transposase n=1 Tax=Cryptosporangium japonicum TaxID=80872 RepID=A0ABP3EUR0_9ACTN
MQQAGSLLPDHFESHVVRVPRTGQRAAHPPVRQPGAVPSEEKQFYGHCHGELATIRHINHYLALATHLQQRCARRRR